MSTAPVVDGKLFIHDMGADRVVQSGKSILDNTYRNGTRAELAKAVSAPAVAAKP